MEFQSRAFEAGLEAAGTPLRCPRAMTAQPLQVWTARRLAAALLQSLASTPALLVPALSRRRA